MQAKDLIVSGASRFLNTINGNINGTASNVTGTVAIANGGTGATTRLGAAKALTDEPVTTPGFVVGLTDSWGKFGYTSIANLKTTLGSAAAASGGTAITMCTTGEKYTWNNKLDKSGGTMTGNITYNLHEEISGGTLTCDRTTKVNERGLQYTSTQNSSINPTSNVYIGSRANDLDGISSIVVCTGTDSTWQSGSEYRTHITPSGVQVLYGNKTQSSSVTIQSGDIMNNSKWDGTNTSLVAAVTAKATILAETIASLTFSSGVATLAKKTGYILINIYPYDRNDNGYGITSFTEQKNGSYQIRNNTTNLSASLAARAIWLKV